MIVAFDSSGTELPRLSYTKTSHVASPICVLGYSLGFFYPKCPLAICFKSELNGPLKICGSSFKNCGCNNALMYSLQEVKLDNQDGLLGLRDSM